MILQRNLAQYWTKRLQIVIFLILITILGCYKLDCAKNLKKNQRNLEQSWAKWFQIVIFLIFITILGCYKLDCAQNFEKKTAQSSAILDKMTSNSNIFNFYHHFRML